MKGARRWCGVIQCCCTWATEEIDVVDCQLPQRSLAMDEIGTWGYVPDSILWPGRAPVPARIVDRGSPWCDTKDGFANQRVVPSLGTLDLGTRFPVQGPAAKACGKRGYHLHSTKYRPTGETARGAGI